MSDWELAVGVEPKDEYDKAKLKLIECLVSLSQLTPSQQQQLFNELVSATKDATNFQHMVTLLKNWRYR